LKCPKCQAENPEQNQFCRKCGSKLSAACPNCSADVLLADKFCGKCGHELGKLTGASEIDFNQPQSYTPKFLAGKILNSRSSIEGERKLVTVLFADVANFTSIAEKLDPEEVHQIMDGCFRILIDEIHSYEGTINQFTGDGVMALFGAPVAHEDHAQRACRAALAIQKAMAEYGKKIQKDLGIDFRMRMGLNSGPVVVGVIGDDLRMDYTAVGDTTNLAMRMESIAPPGSALISENTCRLAKAYFEIEALGPASVKGKEYPQQVFKLIKFSDVQTRFDASVYRGLVNFVGRKDSLTTMIAAWDKAKNNFGQVLGVSGEAGVGKSRLLLEFKNSLPDGCFNYLEGRCHHFGGPMAYLPFLDILRSYFGVEEYQRPKTIKENIIDKLTAIDKNLLLCSAPAYQELLSLNVDDENWHHLEPNQRKERTFEALRNLFIRLSEENPVILAVEDLHWIDKTSEEFISYFIDWIAKSPILLIFLYRPDYNHQWNSKSRYSQIGLDQLTEEPSTELISAILEGGEVSGDIKEIVLNRSAGNPLFIEEFTHALLETESIQKKNKHYVLAKRIAKVEIPDTIQGIIAARMDRLDDGLKSTMQLASVIGRDFAFRILHTITGMQEGLKSYLLNLQRLEFIYEKNLFPELEYIFKHALIQEVAYNSLLLKKRKAIHRKIGGVIEKLYPERIEENCEALAYHYGRSDNKDKALEYLVLANRKTAQVCAINEAREYFDEIMNILDKLPDNRKNKELRINLLVNQAYVFELLWEYPKYHGFLSSYEAVAVELENQDLTGKFYARLGHCEFWNGKMDKTIQASTRAIELFKATGNFENAVYAYANLVLSYWCLGDYGLALKHGEMVIRMLDTAYDPFRYVWTLSEISLVYSCLGRWDSAVENCQKALGIAEEYSNNSLISFAAWCISVVYSRKGDLPRAVEYGNLAFEKASTPSDRILSQAALGWTLCRSGEPGNGIDHLKQVLKVYQVTSCVPTEIAARIYFGEGYWLAGEFEKAEQMLEKALNLAELSKMSYEIAWSHRLLGEIALGTSPARATPHFEQSIGMLQEIKAENELALAYAGYGRLHRQQGQFAQAREYLTKALEVFERLGTLVEPDRVREIMAELPEA
jgi:class 3 adenylate cyclase/tetratricopeptide (TPR) repeat protein